MTEEKGGRVVDLLEHEKRGTLAKLVNAHITQRVLDELDIDRWTFDQYLIETQHRLGPGRCTVDQMVGTFLEVVGEAHPAVFDLRWQLINLNVEMAISSLLDASEDFVDAGSATLPKDALGGAIDLPWKNGKKASGMLQARPPPGIAANEVRLAEWHEARMQALQGELDWSRVEEIRDLKIAGAEFCDRAVLLRLKDNRYLMLLSEEYKTSGSGGIGPQSAARDNRLFNDSVGEETDFHFTNSAGMEVSTTLGKLVLNARSTTTDKLGVKAARNDRLQTRIQNVTKGVKEKKKIYGDNVRLGDKANAVFFMLRIQYPGQSIRNFFEGLHRESPKR